MDKKFDLIKVKRNFTPDFGSNFTNTPITAIDEICSS